MGYRAQKSASDHLALIKEATAGLEPAIEVLQTSALTNLATSPEHLYCTLDESILSKIGGSATQHKGAAHT